MTPDILIAGAGIVALTSAIAAADRGLQVLLVGTNHKGEASEAAAGLLAPLVEPELAGIQTLAIAARDYYAGYVLQLLERTEIAVPLNRNGALQLALDEADVYTLRNAEHPTATWLTAADVAQMEPALTHAQGALFIADEGCIDPLLLLSALRTVVATHTNITVANEDVCRVGNAEREWHVVTDQEGHYSAPRLVLAAGAWSAKIGDLPRAIPVTPVRGQMIAIDNPPLQHIVFGAGGYLVPRDHATNVCGSTLEETGFDASTTPGGIGTLRLRAAALYPALAQAPVTRTWAGLRPMTPDGLPLLGEDAEYPGLYYACGHARNGILLAPLLSELLADLLTETPPSYDLAPFRPDRF